MLQKARTRLDMKQPKEWKKNQKNKKKKNKTRTEPLGKSLLAFDPKDAHISVP